MNCPKCRAGKLQALILKTQQGPELHVDQCSICGGVWFDHGELDRYLSRKLDVLESPQLHATLAVELDHREAKCPRCAVPLKKASSPQNDRIQGDQCPKCAGLWLDSGEADGIALAQKVNVVFDNWLAKLKPEK